ncbi:MAG: LysR family transcriptional regulator, partial [Chloroflexi bacterium]
MSVDTKRKTLPYPVGVQPARNGVEASSLVLAATLMLVIKHGSLTAAARVNRRLDAPRLHYRLKQLTARTGRLPLYTGDRHGVRLTERGHRLCMIWYK